MDATPDCTDSCSPRKRMPSFRRDAVASLAQFRRWDFPGTSSCRIAKRLHMPPRTLAHRVRRHRGRDGKLQALTVLHNYALQRHDGTTAAERFYGDRPRDLFAWLLAPFPRRLGRANRATPPDHRALHLPSLAPLPDAHTPGVPAIPTTVANQPTHPNQGDR